MTNNKLPEDAMFLDFDCKKVANLLKQIVNKSFGCEVHKDIGDMPSVFDLAAAITVLDNEEIKTITITKEKDDD